MVIIYFRGEYFLIDYIQKYGNFNIGAMDSMFSVEGYHDTYNWSSDELKTKSSTLAKRRLQGQTHGANRIYDFVFIPNCGFLNSNLPLLNNCELKLSFDRVNMEQSMMTAGDVSVTEDMTGSPLEIKDCEAITEYIMSDDLEKYFMSIDNGPIPYYYQECDVTIKGLPKDETNFRFDNIKGGKVPTCMFVGLIPTASLNGKISESCTSFDCCFVNEFNITLNGNSVSGFPLENKLLSPVYPFYKFMDATSRYMNPVAGDSFKLGMFMHNWIYAHRFEGELSEQGWLGLSFKLPEALTEAHSLVMWCVYDCALTIDKFHQIEKVDL